jgi:catechol 2,3-dioxygenase-like lactoylglutathione lyase family enzyme
MESCLYATDLKTAEAFYTSVLGLAVITREAGRHVFFRCGEGVVLIFNPDHTSTELTRVEGAQVPLHGTRGAGHLAFRVEAAELPQWRVRLDATQVAIESEVQWPQGGASIYFRDPAGNSIELVTPETWRNGPVPKKT